MPRGRVCGTPNSGILGSLIPSTGDNGPAYAYNDLSLPADAGKEISGQITVWPSAGTLFAYEDTSFSFTGAPDGTYKFQYQLNVNGIPTGSPVAVSITIGTAGVVGSVGWAEAPDVTVITMHKGAEKYVNCFARLRVIPPEDRYLTVSL